LRKFLGRDEVVVDGIHDHYAWWYEREAGREHRGVVEEAKVNVGG